MGRHVAHRARDAAKKEEAAFDVSKKQEELTRQMLEFGMKEAECHSKMSATMAKVGSLASEETGFRLAVAAASHRRGEAREARDAAEKDVAEKTAARDSAKTAAQDKFKEYAELAHEARKAAPQLGEG